MKDIVIVGEGGFAKEVKLLIDQINQVSKEWQFLGFISNNSETALGNDDWLLTTDKKIYCVIAIGNTELINNLSKKFHTNTNIVFPNLIHPGVILDKRTINIGKGNIICAGNIFTCDIQIGSFNIFNLSCTIGHDCSIGSFNVINPKVIISGGVQILDGVFIGTGAIALQYTIIGYKITIGAGALINKNITEKGTYVGTPAKLLRK